MNWVKLAIIAAIFIAVGFGAVQTVNTYHDALAAAHKAAQDLKDERDAHAATKLALQAQKEERAKADERAKKLDSLAKEKIDEAEQSKVEAAEFQAKYAALKRSVPAVKAWADQPIPPDVRRLLLERPAEAGDAGRGEGKNRRGARVDDGADRGEGTGVPAHRRSHHRAESVA